MIYRNGNGQLKRKTRSTRNVRRLHLQCAVTKGPGYVKGGEVKLRQKLWKLLQLEGLTSRRYARLISKRTRPLS